MAVDSGTVAIDPGKTFEKSYDIESAGVFLFEFKTQRHDVQFTALWLPAEGNPEVFFPLEKVDSHRTVIRGTQACDQTGRIILRWSNEYSILRSKTVHYSVSFAEQTEIEPTMTMQDGKEETSTYLNSAWSKAKSRFGAIAGATMARPAQVVGSIQGSFFPAIDRAWGFSKSVAFGTVKGITKLATQLPGSARDTREALDGSLQVAKATLDVIRSEECSQCTKEWLVSAEAAGRMTQSPEAINVMVAFGQLIQAIAIFLASASFRAMLRTLPSAIRSTYRFAISGPTVALIQVVLAVLDRSIDIAKRALRMEPLRSDEVEGGEEMPRSAVVSRATILEAIEAMVVDGKITPEQGLEAIAGVIRGGPQWTTVQTTKEEDLQGAILGIFHQHQQ